MSYRPTYPPLPAGKTYRGAHGHTWTRPDGHPYPEDATYKHMVGYVDTFPTAYLTSAEILKRRVQRRKWLEMVTVDRDGCWLWIGHLSKKAQRPIFVGVRPIPVKRDAKTLRYTRAVGAAQWMLEQWFPNEVPKTIIGGVTRPLKRTMTTCGKPTCVRPQCRRTSLGWMVENYRGQRGGAVRSLTPDQVRDARQRYAAGGVSQGELAAEYGVNRMVVSKAIRGETYKWIPEGLRATETALPPFTRTLGPSDALRGAESDLGER